MWVKILVEMFETGFFWGISPKIPWSKNHIVGIGNLFAKISPVMFAKLGN